MVTGAPERGSSRARLGLLPRRRRAVKLLERLVSLSFEGARLPGDAVWECWGRLYGLGTRGSND